MLDERRIRDIVDVLEPLGLDALWVFGSVAAGSPRPDSDLDLAGLFKTRPDFMALLGARADVGALVGREVDLVDLEQVSPVLAMQVMRHGRLLHEKDPDRRTRFVAGLIGRYEDVKRMQEPIVREAMRRLRGQP